MSGFPVDEVLVTLRDKRRRLPYEIGAFLVLSVVDELVEEPRRAEAKAVVVRDDGTVDVSRAERCTEADALLAVRALLSSLLAAAGEGLPSMMLEILDGGANDTGRSLIRLRDELEAALVPLNRDAARRVLARTLRDLQRASSAPPRSEQAVDDELDALLEGRQVNPKAEGVVIRSHELEDTRSEAPRGEPGKTSIFRDAPETSTSEADERGSSLTPFVVAGLLAFSVLALVVFATRTPRAPRADAPTTDPRAATALAPVPAALGEIELRVSPEGAIVREFVGRAPTLVDEVPVGVAQELIALAEDGTALRAMVAADSAYRDVDALAELEVPLAGEPAPAPSLLETTALDAANMGSSSGRSGRVRVTSAREGLRVYRTVGFAPMARLERVRVTRSHELLVSAPGHVTQRVVVAPSDFREAAGLRRATLEVALRPN